MMNAFPLKRLASVCCCPAIMLMNLAQAEDIWYNHKGEPINGPAAQQKKAEALEAPQQSPQTLNTPLIPGSPFLLPHEELIDPVVPGELLRNPLPAQEQPKPQVESDIPQLHPLSGEAVALKNGRYRQRRYSRSYWPYYSSYYNPYRRSGYHRSPRYRYRGPSGLSFYYNNRSGSGKRWGVRYRTPGLRVNWGR